VKFSEVKKELKADPEGVPIDASGWPARYLENSKETPPECRRNVRWSLRRQPWFASLKVDS
jgi:hypothetical protein